MKLQKIALTAALALSLSSVFAEEEKTDRDLDIGSLLRVFIAAKCPEMVKSIASDADLKPVLQNRPTDLNGVCACAMGKLDADTKLKNSLNVPMEEAQTVMESKTHRAYFITRMMSSIFPCLGADLDQSLEATPLPGKSVSEK